MARHLNELNQHNKMVSKPNILIGIKPNGDIDVIIVSGNADEVKQAFDAERDNPSGNYVQIQEYRRPPYRRRRDLSGALPSSDGKKAAKKRAS